MNIPIASPGFVKKKRRVYCLPPFSVRLGGVALNIRIMDGIDTTAKNVMHSPNIIQKQPGFFSLPVKRSCGTKIKRKIKLAYIPLAGASNIAAMSANIYIYIYIVDGARTRPKHSAHYYLRRK